MQSLQFSPIVAGTMTWGIWGKNLTTQQMTQLITDCVANQITSFDHADIYGDYTTETAFGKAFKESNINRNDVQFISKCGIQLPNVNRHTTVKHYQYSKTYIIESVTNSLKNLHTDYLDVLLLHRPSPLMQVEEIAAAIDILISQGKIKAVGVSNFSNTQTALLHSKIDIKVNQIEFSLTHNEAMLNGSLDYMQTNQIQPMSWSPLGTVFKLDNEQTQRIKAVASSLTAAYNTTVDGILLAWILKHPAGIIPVCGTTEIARLKTAIAATSIDMDLQDWFKLWEASAGHEVA